MIYCIAQTQEMGSFDLAFSIWSEENKHTEYNPKDALFYLRGTSKHCNYTKCTFLFENSKADITIDTGIKL